MRFPSYLPDYLTSEQRELQASCVLWIQRELAEELEAVRQEIEELKGT